jgi:uncharacterized protein YdhG (YjbR/CyaY superfamily)
MQRDCSSPAAYRQSVAGKQRKLLEAVRQVIFEVHPEVEESIGYGMLKYEQVAHVAAQKHYVSIYMDPKLLDPYRQQLPSNCGKSCIRYRSLAKLDTEVLQAILRTAS